MKFIFSDLKYSAILVKSGKNSQIRTKWLNPAKTVNSALISQKKSKLSKSAKSAMGFGFRGFVIVDLD